MESKQNIGTIPQDNKNNIEVISDYELEYLEEKMEDISNQISYKFCGLRQQVINVENMLKENYNIKFFNNNFDQHELTEEQIDMLIFDFMKIKELIKKGREIRYYKEYKTNEKEKKKLF